MAVYERPVWQLMLEFADEHAGSFRFAELDSWFQRRYPAIESSTLRAHLHQMTVGASGTDRLPRMFTRVEHGVYRRSKSAELAGVVAASSAPTPLESASVDVVLVTCVKSKRSRPAAAKELYISPLFQKQRAYVEQTGLPWFILSAEHGLVARTSGWRRTSGISRLSAELSPRLGTMGRGTFGASAGEPPGDNDRDSCIVLLRVLLDTGTAPARYIGKHPALGAVAGRATRLVRRICRRQFDG
jgi:hypothetical protein